MLARQSKVFEPTQMVHGKLGRSSLLFSIVKAALRALLNQTRKLILTNEQYKRAQADILYVSDTLWELSDKDDEMIISGFYFEIATSLKERVIGDIEGLSQNEMEQVLNFTKSKVSL